jgi:peptidoglycan/xylan/chitin deacetylase (PgdA/CDA1 family)
MFGSSHPLVSVGRGYLGGLLRGSARRRGLRVYRYHGVVAKRADATLERNHHNLETFSQQMAYLRRFRVISLAEFLAALDGGRWPKSAAMVTFDDGFANNLLVAEVMQRYKLPWTLFVSVGELGEDRALWPDEFSMLVLHGDAPRIDALEARWDLSTRAQRERTFRELRPRIKALPAAARTEALEAIRPQFPAGESLRILSRFPSLRMMTWEQLEQLAAGGVTIGSHGVHHELHHSDQPPSERRRELVESRRQLEERLARPCRAFAYPNGNFVSDSAAEVAAAGYAAAFTTETALVDRSMSRYLLPRLAAPQSLRRFVRVHCWQDSAPAAAKA